MNPVGSGIANMFQTLNLVCQQNPAALILTMFVIGCAVGSFLNVLALRSLKEESILWPSSYCPQCKHSLAVWDNIPIISYLILGGKCRYCKERISWQYPIVELVTGILYAAITYVFLVKQIPLLNFESLSLPLNTQAHDYTHDLFKAIQDAKGVAQTGQSLDSPELGFYKYGLFVGCLAFASTLIAVTVTDIREKLIPHEITYPSMLIGIAFSAAVRGDFMGAMAGIGASYIIFDFLAFYGLKLYMMSHPAMDEDPEDEFVQDNELDRTFDIRPPSLEEPVEVMGGGDAVLSAVMSAYLGWQGLILALLIGFVAGTVMGLILLFVEMKKAQMLKECFKKGLVFGAIGAAAMCSLSVVLFLFLVMSGGGATNPDFMKTALTSALNSILSFAGMGLAAGVLLGVVSVGTRVSKPFPFGPALALGGFVSMFLIPYWLPFYFPH